MKGIILHGGHGTRLRPLTHTGPKQLLPIANKPMSQYALEDLRNIGIKEIAIIVGDLYPEKVKEYYGDGSKFGVKITYIYQDEPKGISQAISLCQDFIGNDKFVVYLGDNILRKDLTEYASKFESTDVDALILLCEVDNPSRFGIAELDKENPGKIKTILEKPKHPPSNLAIIGLYFLTPKIFEIIKEIKPSWRGELEITDALQLLMNKGNTIDYDLITGWWKDTGTPEDILHANQLVLDSIGHENQFIIEPDSKVHGNIVIGKDTEISRDSFVIGPIIIGKNCNIGPAVRIGPYVSVGDNCIITKCNIDTSIVMNNCIIQSKKNISSSIIAHGSEIKDSDSSEKSTFLLGERSNIKI